MIKLLFIAVIVSGCSARYTPTEESLLIKNETRYLTQSKVARMAGLKVDGYTYFFILNENKSFSAVVDMDASKKYDYCAGTFEDNADTLNFNYYKNFKSIYFTDKAVIDHNSNELVFIDADSSKTKRIKFLDEQL